MPRTSWDSDQAMPIAPSVTYSERQEPLRRCARRRHSRRNRSTTSAAGSCLRSCPQKYDLSRTGRPWEPYPPSALCRGLMVDLSSGSRVAITLQAEAQGLPAGETEGRPGNRCGSSAIQAGRRAESAQRVQEAHRAGEKCSVDIDIAIHVCIKNTRNDCRYITDI